MLAVRGRGEHTLTFGYGDFEVAIVWLGQECRQRRPDSTLQRQAAECLRTSELCHVFRFLMALPEAGCSPSMTSSKESIVTLSRVEREAGKAPA